MYSIRHFAHGASCRNIEELKQLLQAAYCGESVSIQLTLQSGIKHCIFIDVLPSGRFAQSYTGEDFELAQLKCQE